MKMKKPLTTLLLIASFTALAQKAKDDPYTGQSKTQIMQWFGKPETRDTAKSGEILTFRRVHKYGEGSRPRPMPSGNSIEDERFGQVKRIERFTFSFNKKDLVRTWKIDTLR
jgi:hypothetical protein